MTLEVIGTLVTGILGGGGITAVLTAVMNRRKSSAEGRAVEVKGELRIVDAAGDLVAMLRDEVDRLSRRMAHAEDKAGELERVIEELRNENQRLESELANLREENQDLRGRCTALEAENQGLKKTG